MLSASSQAALNLLNMVLAKAKDGKSYPKAVTQNQDLTFTNLFSLVIFSLKCITECKCITYIT